MNTQTQTYHVGSIFFTLQGIKVYYKKGSYQSKEAMNFCYAANSNVVQTIGSGSKPVIIKSKAVGGISVRSSPVPVSQTA
jgi:hypothetical protein